MRLPVMGMWLSCALPGAPGGASRDKPNGTKSTAQ